MTVLKMLNASNRSSNLSASLTGNERKRDVSRFQYPGVRNRFRPRLPNVYCAGISKAAVLMTSSDSGFLTEPVRQSKVNGTTTRPTRRHFAELMHVAQIWRATAQRT